MHKLTTDISTIAPFGLMDNGLENVSSDTSMSIEWYQRPNIVIKYKEGAKWVTQPATERNSRLKINPPFSQRGGEVYLILNDFDDVDATRFEAPLPLKDNFNVSNNLFKEFKIIAGSFINLLEEARLKQWGFELDNKGEIIDFLLNHPEVKNTLADAKNNIEEYFPDAMIVLSAYRDYEENYEVLNIVIRSSQANNQLLDNETLLFNNWFGAHYKNHKGKLNLRVYPL